MLSASNGRILNDPCGIGNNRPQPYVGFMDSALTAEFNHADFGETIDDQTRLSD
jgi:hypothetical protein